MSTKFCMWQWKELTKVGGKVLPEVVIFSILSTDISLDFHE